MKIKTISFYLNQPRISNLLLAILLLVGFILRLYKLETADGWLYSMDVSKDILVGEHIVKYKEFTLAAPCAVGGQGFLKNSPLHYYLMAFFWLLTGSPVGVLFCGVVLGVITIYLSFLIGKELESRSLGLLFALFFTFNDMLIVFSSLTIQPFYLSFFTVLTIYLLLKFRKNNKIGLLCLAVLSIWLGLNLHYSFLQLFFGFNLLILAMLLLDKKVKKVRIGGWLSYGLSTLILMILWLVTSQNYEFVTHFEKMTSLVNNQMGITTFWQNNLDNIKSLFGLVFLGQHIGNDYGWLIWIWICMCLIFLVFLWLKKKETRGILLGLIFLMSGYLMVATMTDGIFRNYFNTYVPIILFLVIYLFYKMTKINWWFGLGLILLFFMSWNAVLVTLANKSQITVSNLTYAELIGDTIYEDYKITFNKDDFDFNIFMANNYNSCNLGTAFYHFLEAKYGRKLEVFDYGFRGTEKKVNYVVCMVSDYKVGIENDCLTNLKQQAGRFVGPKLDVVRSVIADDKIYIIYRNSDLTSKK